MEMAAIVLWADLTVFSLWNARRQDIFREDGTIDTLSATGNDPIGSVIPSIWNNVYGWVGHRVPHILKLIQEIHVSNQVTGDIVEIGVHHGKLFFIMAAVARPNEKCIAIDLFDDQEKNLDHSGKGSLSIFTKHVDDYLPQLKPQITAISADSLSMTPATIRDRLASTGARLFSVDGGHTVKHVINDMELAQELIVPGGVILLDDFLGPHWPSVSEGLFEFLRTANRRLAPFLIFQNKLFLTTYSEHPQMMVQLRKLLDRDLGTEIHTNKWRYAEIGEHKVLCFAG
jgi:cephalosporin hydroxylase